MSTDDNLHKSAKVVSSLRTIILAGIAIFAAGWQASIWLNADLVRYGDDVRVQPVEDKDRKLYLWSNAFGEGKSHEVSLHDSPSNERSKWRIEKAEDSK